MNVVGRQVSRSNTAAHHQRQYSDNFLDSSFSSKWLQSSNVRLFDLLAHLIFYFLVLTVEL